MMFLKASARAAEFVAAGQHVGWWITRSVLAADAVHGHSVGEVVGFLGPEDSDFLDASGNNCALWRVRYASTRRV